MTNILIEHRTTPDGKFIIQHEIKPHKVQLIKQLPGTKRTYTGKNPAGGRKCAFTQSKAYKRKYKAYEQVSPAGIIAVASKWGT